MGNEEFVSIPHFINPQLFWYHTVDGQSPAFIELQRIEETVQSQFTAKQSAALRPHRPIVGEIVAIAFVSWNKYIRARVDYIAKYTKSEDQYVVWALDYGFPFQTKQCYIRKLSESYTQITDHIKLGAVANVVPAELDFDFVTTTSRLVAKPQWAQRAVELLEKVINDAASISFIESFCADGASQKQHFGDLKIINHSGDEFFVSDYLIKLNYAISCVDGDFRDKLSTLQTIKVPCWQTNSKDMKIIENKLNTLNVSYAHQGKFDLSGTLSETSCDTFSKQKVMDWCERNQNFQNKNDSNMDALGIPTPAFDATDISFDDSVSVNNFKVGGKHSSIDETVMGFAGALHESRRKKYEGKGLPPKPAPDVFEVIPEKKIFHEKNEGNKSEDSLVSTQSHRAKALVELRKKRTDTIETNATEERSLDDSADMFTPSSKRKSTSLAANCSKRLQNITRILEQKTSSKPLFAWLGQQVVFEMGQIKDEDIQRKASWGIQQLLRDCVEEDVEKRRLQSSQQSKNIPSTSSSSHYLQKEAYLNSSSDSGSAPSTPIPSRRKDEILSIQRIRPPSLSSDDTISAFTPDLIEQSMEDVFDEDDLV